MKIDLFHPQDAGFLVAIVLFALAILYYGLRITVLRKRPSTLLPAKAYHCVLLPFELDSPPDSHAVALVLHAAGDSINGKSESILEVTCIISVPRSLPLDTPMATQEAEANQILQDLVAATHSPIAIRTQVRRARNFVDETLRLVQENKCDLLALIGKSLYLPYGNSAADDTREEDPLQQIQVRTTIETFLLRS